MQKISVFISLLAVLLFAAPVYSAVSTSKARCGTHLVGIGDASYEVLQYCGTPTMTVDLDDHAQSSIWFYDRDGRLLVRFYINNGTVYKVLQGK
jgi:hypothetical protein